MILLNEVTILTRLVDDYFSHAGRLFLHQCLFDQFFWSADYPFVRGAFEKLFPIPIVAICFGDT